MGSYLWGQMPIRNTQFRIWAAMRACMVKTIDQSWRFGRVTCAAKKMGIGEMSDVLTTVLCTVR